MSSCSSALVTACKNGDEPTARIFLHRANDVNCRIHHEMTLLMLAVIYNRRNVVQLLLERNADVDLQDDKGRTALMLASCPYMVEILLKKNANTCIQDHDGRTALMYACTRLHFYNVVQDLLAYRADVNIQDKHGATALHVACSRGTVHHVRALLEPNYNPYDDVTQTCFKKCPDLSIRNNMQKTALDIANEMGRNDIARVILWHQSLQSTIKCLYDDNIKLKDENEHLKRTIEQLKVE